MKISRFLILLFISVMLFAGCKEDDGPEPQQYAIKVTNTTNENMTLYLSSDGSGFKSMGNIPTGEFREYSGMVLNVNYIIRASLAGQSAAQYVSEQSFSNANADVKSLNFDITL